MTTRRPGIRPCAILTRPAGQADGLAAALRASGIDVLTFPLLDIAPQSDDGQLGALDDALANLCAYALVVFVSPNAVTHTLQRLGRAWPASVPVAVVGPGSAAALAEAGIAAPTHAVIVPPGGAQARFDSESLLAQLDLPAYAGRHVLLVRGGGGRELLADTLRAHGARLDVVSAYTRRAPAPGNAAWQALDDLLASATRCAWVLTSSEATRHLASLVAARYDAATQARIYGADCFTSHARIANAARAAGFDRITQCAAGDDNLLAALQSWADPIQAKHDDR
ncbi:bifunctional uroporphyrinogen-III synthetase/uroporphyrin-III C-methyltransferase [Pandoraea terrae]|uniref:Uroporphyrinogen-III synthase n=1 Tax=Pandoraea terrae TaxID=1537710 RepID=A0A5E4RK97_9BURK|nr:uroporphyrinogen-III synthase [Pandoraea terrae]VVD63717.1 bifunctional uroporphyrinogen-III synthetase/uroporphyrin-III C-methyltransferase [Pandoraea terrae]